MREFTHLLLGPRSIRRDNNDSSRPLAANYPYRRRWTLACVYSFRCCCFCGLSMRSHWSRIIFPNLAPQVHHFTRTLSVMTGMYGSYPKHLTILPNLPQLSPSLEKRERKQIYPSTKDAFPPAVQAQFQPASQTAPLQLTPSASTDSSSPSPRRNQKTDRPHSSQMRSNISIKASPS